MKKFDNTYIQNPMRTHVYRELEAAILDGVFAPGDNLTETKLSAELGVSRTPIREALMQLELEGLVENIPGKGCVVIGVNEQDIDDIYTIRMRIEGLAASRAAQTMTPSELSALREIVELQEFYVNRGDTMQVWHLDSRFHEYIYQCCRSRPLKQILSLFHNYIQKAREASVKAGRAKASTSEHRAIFDAIAAGDADRAEELMATHSKNARDHFFDNLR